MFSPLLSIKHQLGFRLFRGETLNAISAQVNAIGASTPAGLASITANVGTTITAAQIAAGNIIRSGPTAAFTDTLDTGANMDATLGSGATTSLGLILAIQNTTAFVETLSGATGMTVSGIAQIQPNSTSLYLLQCLTAPQASSNTSGTYQLTFLMSSAQDSFAGGNALVATPDNGTTQTLTAAMISGGQQTFHTSTGGTTPSLTLPLGTAMDTALPNMPVGQSYVLRVINSNSGTATIVTNTGWTLTGTLTLATNTWRDFVVTRTAAGTYTAVSVGTGSAP